MAIDQEQFKVLQQAAEAGLLRKLAPGKRTISMSGRLSMKRADFVKLVTAVGGVWHEHPQPGTSFLIVGDTSIHGYTAKMREAERWGAKVITESEFIQMIKP